MATLQTLKTYYSNILRVGYSAIPAADAATLASLAAQVDAGTAPMQAATDAILRMAANTTSVATLSYQFFTDHTVGYSGLEYLVAPAGPNPNNLNGAYYQSFNVENRFINFAVNLGKAGEGQALFAERYGALSLSDTLAKAYTEIFGTAPTAAKIAELLNAQVPNGVGGAFTRAEYFATYGQDGLTGIGTKAALVGWLLAQAAKEDVGSYARANDALLMDLGADGMARLRSDLVDDYGPQAGNGAGATIAFATNQSVTPDATDPALRSTERDDTVTGAGGLDSGRSVLTADGDDTISIAGVTAGLVDGGAGDDVFTVATLNPVVEILGGFATGTIRGGDGNDLINVTNRLAWGSLVDGGAGDDTLRAAVDVRDSDLTLPVRRLQTADVEHIVITKAQNGIFGPPQTTRIEATSLAGVQDITLEGTGTVILSDVADGVITGLRNVTAGDVAIGYHTQLVFHGPSSTAIGARVDLHLDNVGAAGTGPTVSLSGAQGVVTLSVDSDSTLAIFHALPSGVLNAPNQVVIRGLGRLTTAFDSNINVVDASAAVAVDLTRVGSDVLANVVTLSTGDDRAAFDLLRSVNPAISTVTLGAGADTLSLYQDGFNAPRFGNLHITGATVDGYLKVADFVKGVDHVDLTSAIPSLTPGLTASVGAAATLEQALINVSGQVAANGTGVFEYAGDTWIYHQDATVGVNQGDGLIRLVGVTGLSVGTSATTADIHYG